MDTKTILGIVLFICIIFAILLPTVLLKDTNSQKISQI